VLGKLYISCVYGNQEADARAIAQRLRMYGAPQYLQIPPRRYTYTQYIPYQTRNQVNTALQMRSEGRLNEAKSILEGSLNIYDSHMARRILGEIYLQIGDTREALYHLNRVYSEFSFDPEFISNLIVLHISAGETLKAEGLLNELKRIDPDFRSIDGLTKILSQAKRVN
jgi:tetratricopeptide (TPR) repeat protein